MHIRARGLITTWQEIETFDPRLLCYLCFLATQLAMSIFVVLCSFYISLLDFYQSKDNVNMIDLCQISEKE